ncbi:hypothetical protein A2863_03825 [Candidatus Woesebacteria bacterium RIFCSPHIGHO2_01_FULL_38_9b]|uniref:BioF2-like acetyltransferase domain-containing protein n=1 Tax=Candidatus Woesebacteria bacterium RIFCSPHIGHO2_01_FULL_38_9b TaxID=1802493 RepID=A0A1F7Y5K6_9BACT|nr:MAG: hypothetical protein A2863_03825 [Candidatus Woesebacteria bacterium RIFCSPHIGHO2_01_FULL_38_9b]
MKNQKVKLYNKLDKDLITQWKLLWNHSEFAHPFNSLEWFKVCLEVFKIGKFFIFTLERQKEVEAIFPLVSISHYGVRVFASPGGKYLDKSTLLVKKRGNKTVSILFDTLSRYGNLYLAELDEYMLDPIVKNSDNFFALRSGVTPYIVINPNPLRFLSKKQKSKILNRYKRFENDLKYEHDSKKPHTVINLDLISSKAQKGKATFSDKYSQLLLKKCKKLMPENFLIHLLSYKNNPIIYAAGFVWKKNYLGVWTAYHPDFKHLLPGKILLYKLLNKLQSDGVENFWFGRGDSTLKKEFTPYKDQQYDLYFTKNKFIKYWWKSLYYLKKFVLEHENYYAFYLRLKRYITRSHRFNLKIKGALL